MRIVSLVPSWSETLWEFGVRPVAITNFCVRPRAMFDATEKVGGTKDPKVARIAELRPDLVVVNTEENRLPDVEALRAAGLAIHVTGARTVEEAAKEARALGEAVGKPAEGAALAARVDAALAEVRALRRRPLRTFVPIWKRPWMTLNGTTFASDVLAACGFENVAADLAERYPDVDEAAIRALRPEAALLPDEPYPFAEKHLGDLGAAGIPRDRVRLVDGQALTWYGWRTPEGLREVAAVRAALEGAWTG